MFCKTKIKVPVIFVSVFLSCLLFGQVEDVIYDDFSDVSDLTFLGLASVVPTNVLRITPATPGDTAPWDTVGSVWLTNEQIITNGFKTQFSFRISEMWPYYAGPDDADGGDGFAFVIHTSALNSIGGAGGGMGYDGIVNSVVVEFDVFGNGAPVDPTGTHPNGVDEFFHIAIHSGGQNMPTGQDGSVYAYPNFATATTTNIPKFDDEMVHIAQIEYDSGTQRMKVYLDDLFNPCLDIPIDIGNRIVLNGGKAWIGFTAASAYCTENHDILNWTFVTHPIPFVVTTIPVDNGNISVNGPVTIYFSEDINAASASANVTVRDSSMAVIPGVVNTVNDVVTFTPSGQFTESEVYTVTITSNLQSTGGWGMIEDYTFSFQAGMRILYVDNVIGNDTYNGLTPLTAFRTIQHAADELNNGDPAIVYVKNTGTTYTGPVLGITNLRGQSADNPIRFISYNGSAVISGGADTILLEGAHFVEINGFTVQSASVAGIHLWCSTNVYIKNNIFMNNSLDAIKFERRGLAPARTWGVTSEFITISKNIFFNNGTAVNFSMQGEPVSFYFRNNSYTGNTTLFNTRVTTAYMYNCISFGNSGHNLNSQDDVELHYTMMNELPTTADTTFEVVNINTTANPLWMNQGLVTGLRLQSTSPAFLSGFSGSTRGRYTTQVTPSTDSGLTAANYTLTFTPARTTPINNNGRLSVTFPAGFDLSGVTSASSTTLDGETYTGGNISVNGQTVTIVRPGTGSAHSTDGLPVTLVINNIVNPGTAGNYDLEWEIQDATGNMLEYELANEFYIAPPSADPSISETGTAPGASISGTYTFTGTSDSAFADPAYIYVTLDGSYIGQQPASNSWSWVLDTSVIASGAHTLVFSITNATAKSAADTQTINVNNPAPVVTIISGPTANISTNEAFDITLNVTANSGYYRLNGGAWQSFPGGNTVVNISSTTILEYYGDDGLGNVSSTSTVIYTFDTQAPTVTVMELQGATNEPYYLMLTTDEASGYWSVDNVIYLPFSTTTTLDILNYAPSLSITNIMTLYTYGEDAMGNKSGTETNTYTMIMPKPTASITSPVNGGTVFGETYFAGTAGHTHSDFSDHLSIASILLTLSNADGEIPIPVSAAANWYAAVDTVDRDIPDGDYYVYVTVTDEVGQTYTSPAAAHMITIVNPDWKPMVGPNPVPVEASEVLMTGLTMSTEVRIYTVKGNLVYELDNDKVNEIMLGTGGTPGKLVWQLVNQKESPVGSGVYIIRLSDVSTQEEILLKISVIRSD